MDDAQFADPTLLLCCGGKRCPTVVKLPDGGIKLYEGGVELVLGSDQASLLRAFLEQNGY